MHRRFRTLVIAGVTLTTAASLPAAGAAATKDARGPACGDIISGTGAYTGTVVTFSYEVSAPSCRQITYTLYVLDEPGDATPIASQTSNGDGVSTTLTFSIPATTADRHVCVYATTSVGRHVIDRAPDERCVDLVADDDPPGGLQFR